jgi:hypothetical protein
MRGRVLNRDGSLLASNKRHPDYNPCRYRLSIKFAGLKLRVPDGFDHRLIVWACMMVSHFNRPRNAVCPGDGTECTNAL